MEAWTIFATERERERERFVSNCREITITETSLCIELAKNARGNSPANNVSGLLTENYAFRSSERKGWGRVFDLEQPILCFPITHRAPFQSAAKYRINGTIGRRGDRWRGEKGFFCEHEVRLGESFFRLAYDLTSSLHPTPQKNRHEATARQVGRTSFGVPTAVLHSWILHAICSNTRFRDQSLKGDSNFARIIDGYLGGFPL